MRMNWKDSFLPFSHIKEPLTLKQKYNKQV